LAFLIDLTDDRFESAYDTLCEELRTYAPSLLEKGQVVIGTKIDEPDAKDRLLQLQQQQPGLNILGLSNITGEGLDDVKKAFIHLVGESNKPVDDGFTTIIDTEAEYREEL
jgi:GTP-binding protein